MALSSTIAVAAVSNNASARRFLLISCVVGGVSTGGVQAQTPKELRTKAGEPILVVRLVNSRSDCSNESGPVLLPTIKPKPANGTMYLKTVTAELGATGPCPARQVSAIALIYTPRKNFSGSEDFEVELEADNRSITRSYHVTVESK